MAAIYVRHSTVESASLSKIMCVHPTCEELRTQVVEALAVALRQAELELRHLRAETTSITVLKYSIPIY
jgi:hypothetical protein